ncbi:MAG: BPSL0067 family protein [Leptospiraceae bacterium]|nr:BPSL0067 family protein [Leptospiraceae bacterium]
MSYKLNVEESTVFGKGKFVDSKGKTECVVFVQQTTGAPITSKWTQGTQVKSLKEGEIERGTAIATFDENGKYPTDSLGKHAAIYLSHNDSGITVLDQWNSQGEVKQRLIRFNLPKETKRSNNGDVFFVIE